MSAVKISPAAPVASSILSDPLHMPSFLQNLKALKCIVLSSLGPRGKLKCLQNSAGGSAILTSSSERLLSSFTVRCPITKLLHNAIKDHLSSHGDSGLFALLLSILYIESSLKSGLPANLCATILECFAKSCCDYLRSESCKCRLSFKFENLNGLLSLVNSILSTKVGACLSKAERNQLALLIIQAFLHTIPSSSNDTMNESQYFIRRLLVVTREGLPVTNSCIFPGVLWSGPSGSLSKSICHQLQSHSFKNIKVALLSMSLAGDIQLKAYDKVINKTGISLQNFLLKKCRDFGERLCKDEVQVLLAQKVMHPLMKQIFRNKGLVVMDRLGADLAEQLKCISGASSIDDLNESSCDDTYGQLQSMKLLTFFGKNYVLFQGQDPSVSTLLLCGTHEEVLTEMKLGVQQAANALYTLLQQPWVLAGAGCTETHIAMHVFKEAQNSLQSLSLQIRSSPANVITGFKLFSTCLQKTAMALYSCDDSLGSLYADIEYGHLWGEGEEKCKCGQLLLQNSSFCCIGALSEIPGSFKEILHVSSKDVVLDSFNARLSAYRTASMVAALILKTESCIVNNN